MPAYNPGSPLTPVTANPSLGKAVIMNPFSGPKGSPFDAMMYPSDVYQPEPADMVADPDNLSTGALSTGIGFGLDDEVPGIVAAVIGGTNRHGNYTDNYTPGVTMPDGTTAATLATLLAIGGGKSDMDVGDDDATDFSRALSVVDPYVAQPILAFGNGQVRDGGAGPAFTGFGMKLVTATGTVANGAAIEAGFTNRSGVSITVGNSQFGSNGTASPAVT